MKRRILPINGTNFGHYQFVIRRVQKALSFSKITIGWLTRESCAKLPPSESSVPTALPNDSRPSTIDTNLQHDVERSILAEHDGRRTEVRQLMRKSGKLRVKTRKNQKKMKQFPATGPLELVAIDILGSLPITKY